MFNKINCSS